MFSEAHQRNTKLLKEKEEQEAKYKDLQFKLQEKHRDAVQAPEHGENKRRASSDV